VRSADLRDRLVPDAAAGDRFDNERRAEIEALFQNQEGLDSDVLEETLEYIEEFYEVINDEERVQREFGRHRLDV